MTVAPHIGQLGNPVNTNHFYLHVLSKSKPGVLMQCFRRFQGLIAPDQLRNRHGRAQRAKRRSFLIALRLEVLELRTLLAADFGDAPAPYPTLVAESGAQHEATGPRLG